MKKGVLIVAIAALLALPGVTLAQSAPIGVVQASAVHSTPAPGVPQVDGSGAIQFDPTIHTSIIVDVVVLDPAIPDTWMANYFLSSNLNAGGITSGDADWMFDPVNARVALGPIGAAFQPTDRIVGGIAGGLTLAQAGAGGIEQYMTFGLPFMSPVLVMSHELQLVGSPVVGDQYLIHSDLNAYGSPSPLPGSGSFTAGGGLIPFVGGQPLVVDIVPEPASVLLLLGALPFLRRRR